MITHITKDLVAEVFRNEFSCEASSLRWPPGVVPTKVGTDLGNRQPFVLKSVDEGMFRYDQSNGCISLVVFND